MPLQHPIIFTMPEGIAFWVVMAWVYLMEGRQLQRKRAVSKGWEGDDRYSGLVISVGSSLLQLGGIALAYYQAANMPEDMRHPAYYGGLVVVVCGTILRMHCWKMLGEFFTHTVTIANDHKVINIGAYRFLRHPAYLGGWLNLLGLGLTLGNFASLALITIGSFAIFHYRITVEEHALEKALGEQYKQFKQSRARLIPFVY
jgi:protein-S-isoprenylcysteine O-methyltransferase Ste14